MNRSESKYFNTAIRMDRAFLELLDKKDFAYITVKEICEKAEVNRSTFYLHYETIGDLLCESVQYLNQHFQEYMGINDDIVARLRKCSKEELYLVTPEYLRPYLSYIKEYRRLFKTAVENSMVLGLSDTYDKMFCYVFEPILERFRVPQADRNYMMVYYIHGLMAIIAEWLKKDCADSMEHIIEIIMSLIPKQWEES